MAARSSEARSSDLVAVTTDDVARPFTRGPRRLRADGVLSCPEDGAADRVRWPDALAPTPRRVLADRRPRRRRVRAGRRIRRPRIVGTDRRPVGPGRDRRGRGERRRRAAARTRPLRPTPTGAGSGTACPPGFPRFAGSAPGDEAATGPASATLVVQGPTRRPPRRSSGRPHRRRLCDRRPVGTARGRRVHPGHDRPDEWLQAPGDRRPDRRADHADDPVRSGLPVNVMSPDRNRSWCGRATHRSPQASILQLHWPRTGSDQAWGRRDRAIRAATRYRRARPRRGGVRRPVPRQPDAGVAGSLTPARMASIPNG